MDVSARTHPIARARSHYIRHVSPTHIQPLAQSTHSPVRPHLLTQLAHARPPAHSPIHLPCPRTRPHSPAHTHPPTPARPPTYTGCQDPWDDSSMSTSSRMGVPSTFASLD